MDRLACMTTFMKVADSGHFSAAARSLNKSPASITAQIRSLEDQLGVRLLNRTTRKVSMTEAGRTYYARCAQILAGLEEADQSIQAFHAAPRGTLRLNASIAIPTLITPLLCQFSARYPELSVDLSITDGPADLVGECFDLAIRDTPATAASYISRRIATYRLVVCGSPAYLAGRGTPERPADLAHHDCLRYSGFAGRDQWQFEGPGGRETISVSGPLKANCSFALRDAAIRGQGLCMVPGFLVADELRSGCLVTVMDRFLRSEHAINIVYVHREHLSAKARCFIDFLASHFSAGSKRALPAGTGATANRCPPPPTARKAALRPRSAPTMEAFA